MNFFRVVCLCLLCFVGSACTSGKVIPLEKKDLLSGRYKLLPKKGDTFEKEIILTVRKSESGWVVSGLDVDVQLRNNRPELDNVDSMFASADRKFSQCGLSSHYILCVTRQGARLADFASEEFVSTTGSFLLVLHNGAWELEKLE